MILPAFHQTTWTGYLGRGDYSAVSAAFNVPRAYCGPGPSQAAVWAGIGEYRIGQAGVALDCTGGRASYSAWCQFWPLPAVGLGTVRPGDRVSVRVSHRGGAWTADLTDHASHVHRSVTIRFHGDASTAELITEASDGALAPHSAVRWSDVRVSS
jgi:hypothetical protein